MITNVTEENNNEKPAKEETSSSNSDSTDFKENGYKGWIPVIDLNDGEYEE